MKLYHQNNQAEIYYESELDALLLKFLPETEDDHHFIEISEFFFNAMKEFNTTRLIVDARNMGILDYESQLWLSKSFFKQIKGFARGRKIIHATLIDPEKLMSRVSIANVKERLGEKVEGFDFLEFTDEQELRKYFLAST
ncbi:MAG: hypothetical protein AAGC64_03045 [Bacteroidota bacterium]